MKKFPFYKQLDQMDCGPTCLKMIIKYYGKSIPIESIRKRSYLTKEGVSFATIAEAAESYNINTLAARMSLNSIKKKAPLPCIAHWRERHFVIIYKINKKHIYIADPAHGLLKYSHEEFVKAWTNKQHANNNTEGNILLLEPTPQFYELEGDDEKKDYNFKFLFRYFKPYKKYIFQLFLGLIVGSILQLIFPFLTQAVVDYGISYQNLNFVYLILIAQLVLFISQTSVEIIRSWILLHITSRININLISDFLLKLMKLPIAFFDSKNTGDIMQRIYDHNRIQNFLSNTTLNTLFSAFNLIIFGIVLAYYNLTIFLIFLFGSIIYVLWTLLFLKRRKVLDYKRFDQSSNNQTSLFQLISGMQEIKLNGSERRRRWEWEEIQVKLFRISIKSLTLSQFQQNGGNFINQLKNILISFIAARAVILGDLTLGMMLSIQYIIGQLNLPINNFISFIQTGQDAKISLERLSEIHNKPNEDERYENSVLTLPKDETIYFKNMSFRYGGKASPYVLNNLNFTIPQKKVTAIVGTSGSGKTTLLKLLLKFYTPTKGKIEIGNTKFDSFNVKNWRKNCGSVMQEGYIFGDTIARNITESDSEEAEDIQRLENAAEKANILDFIESLPSGFNTKIGASGTSLSGGQRQRILIARAIYKDPQYIFFDEATSALDANNEKIIMNNLKDFYKDKTVVVVAHRLSTVKDADQIIVLENGNITETGTHEQLAELKGDYYRLIKNQLELGS